MSETVIALAAAKAAAGAVGGMLVRSSAPRIKALLARHRPAPAAVRNLTATREGVLAQKQRDAIVGYLEGHECGSTLRVLAFLHYDRSDFWSDQKDELYEIFESGLKGCLTLDDATTASLVENLWRYINDSIALHVVNLRADAAFSAIDVKYISELLQHDGAAGGGQALISQTVTERVAAQNLGRVTAVHGLVRQIKQAMFRAYRAIEMPHSRRDYQIPVEDLYVHRSLALQNVNLQVGTIATDRSVATVPDHLLKDQRLVIVGAPGAGKSTFVRRLTHFLGSPESKSDLAPVLVELKRYTLDWGEFAPVVARQLAARIQADPSPEVVRDMFSLGYAAVIFDGLDEISDVNVRRRAASDILSFSRRYPLIRCIVTSRRDGYLDAPIDPEQFLTYQLPPFQQDQVEKYVRAWFMSVTPTEVSGEAPARAEKNRSDQAKVTAAAFMADSEGVRDIRTNPLMLSLLCLLYEYEGWIPENRLQVYEDCTNLMFQRWDRIRKVEASSRPHRELWQLFQLLGHWMLFERDAAQPATESEIKKILVGQFSRSLGNRSELITAEADDFLEFCSGRAWLLTKVGTNIKGERLFDFSHRTFMEYFAASHLSRISGSAADLVDRIWPLVTDNGGSIVAQLALQQYDLRSVGGFDGCVLDLIERKILNEKVIEFLLEVFKYILPSYSVLRTFLRESINSVGSSRSGSTDVLTAMAAMSSTALSALDDETSSILKSAKPDDPIRSEGGALCFLAAVEGRRAAAQSVPPNFRRLDKKTMEEVAARHPQALVALHQRDVVGLDDYLDLLGERASISVIAKPTHALFPGPAMYAFQRSPVEELENSTVLMRCLERIARSGSRLIPFDIPTIKQISEVALSVRQEQVDRIFARSTLHTSRCGYYMLTLATACAAFDTGQNWREIASVLPAVPGQSAITYGDTRHQLAERCLKVVDYLELSQYGWNRLFRSWQRKETRFGVENSW